MRMITQGDVNAAARALVALPDHGARSALLRALLCDARRAARHRCRTGRIDPALGNGTLMAAALARPHVPALDLSDTRHLQALEEVISGLIALRLEGE